MWYNPVTKRMVTKRRPVTRDIELNKDMLYYIIMSQLEPDRHPFFSTKRELWEAWLGEKRTAKELGHMVSGALGAKLCEMEDELVKLRALYSRAEDDRKKMSQLADMLETFGFNTWYWPSLLEELRKALTERGLPPTVLANLRRLVSDAGELADVIGELADVIKGYDAKAVRTERDGLSNPSKA